MPKGVYEHTHNARPDLVKINSTPSEDNRVILSHGLQVMALGKANLKDPDDVSKHISDYFQICLDTAIKPSIAGLALALGISRQYVFEITHNNKDNVAFLTVDIIKKAINFINLQMETYMQESKINPVAGIFLMKNNMGYKDQVDYVVTPKNDDENVDVDEIKEKYELSEGDSKIQAQILKISGTVFENSADPM